MLIGTGPSVPTPSGPALHDPTTYDSLKLGRTGVATYIIMHRPLATRTFSGTARHLHRNHASCVDVAHVDVHYQRPRAFINFAVLELRLSAEHCQQPLSSVIDLSLSIHWHVSTQVQSFKTRVRTI